MATFPDLIGPYYREAERRIKRLPAHSNRASSLGGACVRQLVYERTHWDQAELPSVELQLIFEEGSAHEEAVLEELRRAGYQIIEQQTAMEWREYQITGHLDALVVVEGVQYPLDVKSMSPHIWDSIAFRGRDSYAWAEVCEAFTKKPWLRKYLGQITLYCLLRGTEAGILLCKNKATGALAQVNIDLDYAYGETLIQRAIQINQHVAAGTLPARIEFDDQVCPRCPFYATCLPDQIGKDPLVFLEDRTIEALLETRAELEEAGREFDQIDRRVKDWAKARPEGKISIGAWLVTKQVSRTRTVVHIENLRERNGEN